MGWNPKSSPETRRKRRERKRAKEVEPEKEKALKKEQKRPGSVRECGLVLKFERIIIVGVVLETQRNLKRSI